MFSSPPASTHAMDPPPAPIVVISIIGVRIVMPKSTDVSGPSAERPSAISDTSKLVPPMSPVTTFPKPALLAMCPAAMTPAAGPDRAVRTGRRHATSTSMTPPLDCTTRSSPSKPPPSSAPSSRRRYPDTSGCRYAFSAVVEKRSNSRISGRISWEAATCGFGHDSRTAATASASFSGFA